eukprot:367418_1
MFTLMLFICILVMNLCQLSGAQTLDLHNWMKTKSNSLWNKTLSELTILGTHDSGSYNLTHEMMPGGEPKFLLELIKVGEELGIPVDEVITLWSRSQPSNLYNQLLNGTRYFDMRCGFTNNTWFTYHGQTGNTIKDISTDIKRFLDTYDQEIVLIEANGITGSKLNNSDVQILIELFINIFGDYLYPRRSYPNDGFPTYGQMINSKHRILLSINWRNEIIEQYNNIWYGNTFQNTYANSDNLTTMINYNDKQVGRFNNNQTTNNELFKISWTLTPNGDTILRSVEVHQPHDLIQLADTANIAMWNWTQNKLINQNLRIGNIFIFDDYFTSSTQQIINALYK